jgi:Arc/MetJ-type ribon-helix-helix transcriptional regulator
LGVEGLTKDKKGRGEFRTISLPASLVEQIGIFIEEFKYWPTKTDFVREAVIDKLEKYREKLRARET